LVEAFDAEREAAIRREVKKAFQDGPNDPEVRSAARMAFTSQAMLMEKRGRLSDAIRLMYEALSHEPAVSGIRYVAELHVRAGQLDKAVFVLRQIIQNGPSHEHPETRRQIDDIVTLMGTAQRR
jgi:Tetratricopeptide repeat